MKQQTIDTLTAIFQAAGSERVYYVVTTQGKSRIAPVTILSIDSALNCTVAQIEQEDKLSSNAFPASDVHETKLDAFTAFEADQAAELVIAEQDRDGGQVG